MINDRLKQIRCEKGMNQKDFAKLLGIGQSTLAMMEVGKRNISERHLKTICSICNINEQWLRTGKGEMLVQSDDSFLTELCKEYGLDDMDRLIIKSFMKLPDDSRKAIKNLIHNIVEEALAEHSITATEDIDIEKEVDEYRQELESQKKEKISSASGITKEKNA